MRKIALFGVLGCIALVVPASSVVAITNGEPDGNRHPEVGALVAYYPPAGKSIAYCSGTLISPTVFLAAAHCGFLGTAVQVTFDDTYTPASTVYTGTFQGHPDFKPATNSQTDNNPDIALVVLDTAVPGITPARLPTAGLLDDMKTAGTLNQDSQFTSVGYGDAEFVTGPGGQTTTHLQARYFSVGSFNALTSGYLHLTQNGDNGGTCNGDSGGPNFLGGGANETPIIAGLTTTGDTYCHATNVSYRVDTPTARAFLDDYVTVP